MRIIQTQNTEGHPNGWLGLLWNANEKPELRPDQAYITALLPGARKGPHLHYKRRGYFFCIQGEAIARIRQGDEYTNIRLTPNSWDGTVVPPGVPCALYNVSEAEALILNLPSPAFDATDEFVVPDWKHLE